MKKLRKIPATLQIINILNIQRVTVNEKSKLFPKSQMDRRVKKQFTRQIQMGNKHIKNVKPQRNFKN